MRLSTKLIPIVALTGFALLLPAGAANASVSQDPNSGTCYVDIHLDQTKLALSTDDGQSITGVLSNPNNCGNLFPFGVALMDRDGNTNSSETADNHRISFNFSNQDTVRGGDINNLGHLKIKTDIGTGYYYDYTDANGDTKEGNIVVSSSPSVDVRYKAKLSLSAKRAGKYVTLKTESSRFEYKDWDSNANWVANRNTVTFQKFTGGKWHTIKTTKPSAYGFSTYKFKSAKSVKYRALSSASTIIWNATSVVKKA